MSLVVLRFGSLAVVVLVNCPYFRLIRIGHICILHMVMDYGLLGDYIPLTSIRRIGMDILLYIDVLRCVPMPLFPG